MLKHVFSTPCACRKRRLNGEHGPSDEAVKPEASCQQEWHDKDPSVRKGRGCPALPYYFDNNIILLILQYYNNCNRLQSPRNFYDEVIAFSTLQRDIFIIANNFRVGRKTTDKKINTLKK